MYLYHHGILGQKWGVRRTPEQLGHKPLSKRAQRKRMVVERKFEDKAKEQMRELSTAEYKKLTELISKQGDIANSISKTAYSEAKAATRNPDFKTELDKELFDLFGDGCDDEEFFDIECQFAMVGLAQKPKYSPKTTKLANECKAVTDQYFDVAEKIVNRMAESCDYLERTNSKRLRKYQIDGQEVLRNVGWRKMPRVWNAEKLVDYAYGNMDELPKIYSMKEYNEKHSRA